MNNEVKIVPTKYGRGVVANRSWKQGDVVETSDCICLSINQMPTRKQGSPLWSYVFSALNGNVLVALGWTSLMNHSSTDYNLEYEPTEDNKVIFRALKDITPGTELLINYGYDVVGHNKYFGVDTDKLNADTLKEFDMSASQVGVDIEDANINKDLSRVKDQLFDAPDSIKRSFNDVVKYFDDSINKVKYDRKLKKLKADINDINLRIKELELKRKTLEDSLKTLSK